MDEGPKDLKDNAPRRDGYPKRDDITGRPLSDFETPGTESVVGYAGGLAPAVPPSPTSASDTPKTANIRKDIEQTRANISDTVDEIQQRLTPSNLIADAKDTVRDVARERLGQVGAAASDTASQVADTTRRLANQAADTSRRLANQAADRTRRMANQAAGTTRQFAEQAAHTTRRVADRAARRGRRIANQAAGTARENPWLTAAAIAGAGAATWWLVSRRSEDADYVAADEYEDDRGEESLYYDERRRLMDTVRGRSIPMVVAGLGVGYWLWSRQAGRRENGGDGPESLDTSWNETRDYGVDAGSHRSFDDTAGDMRQEVANQTERMRRTVSNAADRARHAVGDVSGRARDATNRASAQVADAGRRAKSQLEYWMDRNPLAVGAAAMAVGVAVGMALPETRHEHRVFGRSRDRLVDNAKQYAGDAMNRAKEKVQDIASKASDAANKANDLIGNDTSSRSNL